MMAQFVNFLAGSGTIMTAGAFNQISIVTRDEYGSPLASGGNIVVTHMCTLGASNEHGNSAKILREDLLEFWVCRLI
jgi:hypothetical protein